MKITHRLLALALLLIVFGLAAATSATAEVIGKSGGLTYVKKVTPVKTATATPTTASAAAACPEGYSITGGGASLSGPPSKTFLASNTNQSKRTWVVQSWHRNAPRTEQTAFGICSKSKALVHERNLDIVGAAPTVGHGTSACGSSHYLSGGALFVGETSSWFLNSTSPTVDAGWQVYAAYASGGPTSLLTDIVCTDGKKPKYVKRTGTLPSGATADLQRSCPHGRSVEGGGGFISGMSVEAHLIDSAPYDGGDADKVPDDGWRVTARNDAGAAKALTVNVTCKA